MDNINCNLCGNSHYEVLYLSNIKKDSVSISTEFAPTAVQYSTFYDIVACKHCGLVYANSRDFDVAALYRNVTNDYAYLDSWNERAGTFRNLLKMLEKHVQGKKILDIGCYGGIFLKEAKKQGYNVIGIEPSEWAFRIASERVEAKVINTSWDKANLPDNYFNIVTLWDVVEHLEDPSSCFRQANKWLEKNGIIAITTHDIKSLFARLLGRKYPWLMKFHLYHFEPRTLCAMLRKHHFEPLKVIYYTKTFSLKYFLSRFGLEVGWSLFKKIKLSINTGDLFMVIAKKKT
ncbi:MAG: class I SAM-dependent methyltransferase [Candidatus Omnitrophica bacterium]|nr:class I SAM-dependent methyltransferase [Candidatus Omnitrophota bacterium]